MEAPSPNLRSHRALVASLVAAGVAVTALSLVGIASLLGWLPERQKAAFIPPTLPAPSPEPAPRAPREYGTRRVEIRGARVTGKVSVGYEVMTGEDVSVVVDLTAHEAVKDLNVGIRITDSDRRIAFGQNLQGQQRLLDVEPGDFSVEFRFKCLLAYGVYTVSAALHTETRQVAEFFHWKEDLAWISVVANLGHFYEGYVKLEPRIHVHSAGNVTERQLLGEHGQHLVVQGTPLKEFKGTVEAIDPPTRMSPTEVRAVLVRVRNAGSEPWSSSGLRRVCVAYHWADADGAMVEYEGERTVLIADLDGGEEAMQWAIVKAPAATGAYRLQLSLLQEYVAWFDHAGCPPSELVVFVGAAGLVATAPNEAAEIHAGKQKA